MTPLHLAAATGCVEVIQVRRSDCFTVKGREMHWQILLDEGANVEAKNDKGMTPLHLAAATGCVEVIQVRRSVCFTVKGREMPLQILLDHGASENVNDRSGSIPYDLVYLFVDEEDSGNERSVADSTSNSEEDRSNDDGKHRPWWRMALIIGSIGFVVLIAVLLTVTACCVIHGPSVSIDTTNGPSLSFDTTNHPFYPIRSKI